MDQNTGSEFCSPFFFLNARNRHVVTGCVLSGSGRGWVGSGKGKQTRGFSPFCADHGARGLDKKRKNGADVAEKGVPGVFNGGWCVGNLCTLLSLKKGDVRFVVLRRGSNFPAWGWAGTWCWKNYNEDRASRLHVFLILKHIYRRCLSEEDYVIW